MSPFSFVTSMISVLFSEPRAGRFVALDAWRQDALLPRMAIALITSLVTTCVIGYAALRSWRAPRLDDNGRYIAVFAAVLAGNAALSFAYTKDEIMLPAGIFYALAAYAGARLILESMAVPRLRPASAAVAIVLTITSMGWTVRAAGVPYFQRAQAFKHRGDWGQLAGELRRGGPDDRPSDERELIDRLRDDALATAAPNPRFEPRWARLVWEE